MEKGRISVIIPCFNGEKTLERCFDSLINQSYKKLEVIVINDGSTDNSFIICDKYKFAFESTGMIFKYVEQKNAGLGGAINTGLKYVSGEYLCWGDVDDFWYPDSMQIRKVFLDQHQEYGSVSSDAECFDEDNLTDPICLVSKNASNLDDENQFMNHLQEQPLYCAGCHMIRMVAFDNMNPQREIYPARHGQNNQLLMPVYYKYKHKFISVPLYGYVISSKSMSHKKLSRKEKRNRISEYYLLMEVTIKSINMPTAEMNSCLMINKNRELIELIDEAAEAGDRFHVYYYAIQKMMLQVFMFAFR